MPVVIKKYKFYTKKTYFVGFIIKLELKKVISKKERLELKKVYLN